MPAAQKLNQPIADPSPSEAKDPLERRSLTAADVMRASEVAELMRVPRSTVYYWARTGRIPSILIGKHRIFIRQQIEAMLLGDPRGQNRPDDSRPTPKGHDADEIATG